MSQHRPTVLLTRPQPQAERFAATLNADAAVVISPILTIVPRALAVELTGFGGVVLTSENGARVLAQLADVAGAIAWCVGHRTASAAAALGMDTRSAGGDVSDLIELLLREHPAGELLYAHGAQTRGELTQKLQMAGVAVQSMIIYDQVETRLSDQALAVLAGPGTVIVPLFSPRSARLLSAAARGAGARIALVALSQAVLDAWDGPKPEMSAVATRPDAPHLKEAIATIWTDLSG